MSVDAVENPLMRAALDYVRTGFAVIPCFWPSADGCSCGKDVCGSPGKHPIIREWPKEASRDENKIRFWWSQWPNANIGIATGADFGLVVLDIDGEVGGSSLDELERIHGKFPPTPRVRTGRGTHIYLRHPGRNIHIKSTAGKIGRGLDVRGDGGFVIAPPSVHHSGGIYSWLEVGDLAPIPEWLLGRGATPATECGSADPRNSSATTPYGAAALESECLRVLQSREGERNETLNKAAFAIGQLVAAGEISEIQAHEELTRAARRSGLNEHEVGATIRSGLGAGKREPRVVHRDKRHEFAGVAKEERRQPPEVLLEDAFHGLAAEFVNTVSPHSEADPVALLAQFLAAFGNLIGRRMYRLAEATPHHLNLFVLLVGDTAKARKGSSWAWVHRFFQSVDQRWSAQCVKGGLSSGEGLIWQVRDPITKLERTRGTKGRSAGYEEVLADSGVEDKRLLVQEAEFSSVLRVARRDGSTLSEIIRKAWETGDLQALTKNSPAKATGAHISIVAHITADELRRRLDSTDIANGYLNRFVLFCVRRSKAIPFSTAHQAEEALKTLSARVRDAFEFASIPADAEFGFSDQARADWITVYPSLSAGRPGLVGAILARAEAQVLRLACIYASLDCSTVILPEHLRAALALWKYAEESVEFLFGNTLGDPDADAIFTAIKSSPAGLTRTEIRDLFGRHLSASRIERALAALMAAGKARMEHRDTAGRRAEVWTAL